MKGKLRRNGFTLVELLVVISIIGILATLITPRFLNQNRRAEIAEAINFLGALRRAQLAYADTAGGGNFLDIMYDPVTESDLSFSKLGLVPPKVGSRFYYFCGGEAGINDCTAYWWKKPDGSHSGSVAVSINLPTGKLKCWYDSEVSPLTSVEDAQGNVLGCR